MYRDSDHHRQKPSTCIGILIIIVKNHLNQDSDHHRQKPYKFIEILIIIVRRHPLGARLYMFAEFAGIEKGPHCQGSCTVGALSEINPFLARLSWRSVAVLRFLDSLLYVSI